MMGHRRWVRITALALTMAANPAMADGGHFLAAPPVVDGTGLLGYANPATVARLPAAETLFLWSVESRRGPATPEWGLFSAVPHLGLATVGHATPGWGREYRLAAGVGDRRVAVGLSRGWFTGSRGPGPRWTLGAIVQPSRRWSFAGTARLDGDTREGSLDVGFRPFVTDRLTLFAQGGRDDSADQTWQIGGDVRLRDGLHIAASWDKDQTVRAGLRLDMGTIGVRASALRPSGADRRDMYGVRIGPDRGSLYTSTRSDFLQLDLHGSVRHRSYALFDEGRSLLGLLATLRRVEGDPSIQGVALNLTGLRIDAAMSWELRQRLQTLRDAGHTIVVYIDRVDLRRYHLASVADHIVLDPAGMVVLQGVAAGQVYMRGALDKLGIGIQEWRYHEYKSALESLNRTGMSSADREQWQALLDDDYLRARGDIAAARGLQPAFIDSLVNEVTGLSPAAAVAAGLVDTVGRWQAVEQIVAQRRDAGIVQTQNLAQPISDTWSTPPQIAIVYALGVCAMDSGIRARELAVELRALAEDDAVRAVVLRVDSPGGDVLASDVVAGAVAACRQQKPIIVSQARLATSGGYWISMEADAIVATPATIAGNIGVVSGWFYNQGFRERLGLSVDHVQVGTHADLGLGFPLPFLGLPLPDRAMTAQEVQHTDSILSGLYDSFIGRVATARGQTPEQIDAVARGRVWAGSAAFQHGLVDTLGGLETALSIARRRAGITDDQQVRIIERPQLDWFSFDGLPGLLALRLSAKLSNTSGQRSGGLFDRARTPQWQSWLQFRLNHNGQPLVMLPQPLLDQFGAGSGPENSTLR